MTKQQFHLDSEALGLLGSVLNEVLNGFEIPEFDRKIGMKRGQLKELLKHLHTLPSRDTVTLDVQQTYAFRNALSETIRELGAEEFHIRTGYDFDLGNAFLERLNQLLGSKEL